VGLKQKQDKERIKNRIAMGCFISFGIAIVLLAILSSIEDRNNLSEK
jgi:hypothetical protein